ncbi:PadR family transcriptional regulator [Terracidiphilus sp.]|jgi:DNA-binding PadR family transcriptional regulator|uniref:PadR family transcriptional regulator n=1 Tax=Terracidiphilus sp. TaxID=1964191 RepID=UPI003C2A3958
MKEDLFQAFKAHHWHFAGHGHCREGREERHGRRPGAGFGPGFGGDDFGGRGPGGPGFDGPRFGRRGFGRGGRERLFDAGDIKLVILKLLSEEPSYGYQLMKTMEERLAGGYSPSAGVIYPTLTMLEEEGLISASTSEGNKKVYSVTSQGLEFLEAHKQRIGELFMRLEEAGEEFKRGRSPEMMKAFMNLRGAIWARLARGNATPEQIQKLSEIVHKAAKEIDEL